MSTLSQNIHNDIIQSHEQLLNQISVEMHSNSLSMGVSSGHGWAWQRDSYCVFLAATKQLYDWFSPSVRLSVCLSVWLSHLFDYVPVIVSSLNFQELLLMTEVTSMQRGQGQRSRVKVTEVNNQLSHFRTITPVQIHIWWNDAQSLMLLRRGGLLFFKDIRQISRSHVSKIIEFDPNLRFRTVTPVLIHQWLQKWCTAIKVA